MENREYFILRRKKLLFVGFGDIATRASDRFPADEWAMTGIARTLRDNHGKVRQWRGAVTDTLTTERLAAEAFDIAVITLTPDGHEPEDYRQAYLRNSEHLLRTWQAAG